MNCSFFFHRAVPSYLRFYHSFHSKKLILNLEVKEYLLFFKMERTLLIPVIKPICAIKKSNDTRKYKGESNNYP